MFDTNKMKLGIFAFSAIFLICIVFFAVGLFDFGTPKVNIITFFDESVQGLEVGSFVKYRGVSIGKVKDITLSVHESRIRVDMEINLNKLWNNEEGKFSAISEKEFINVVNECIKDGLRARIELSGITGGKYIDCDYFARPGDPLKELSPALKKEHLFYIPSSPSMFAGLKTNVTELLLKISSIDYKGISERVDELLKRSNALIGDPNLQKSLANIREISEQLNQTIQNLNAAFDRNKSEELSKKLTETLTSMNRLAQELESTVRESKVPETAAVFRRTSDNVSMTAASLEDAIRRINEVSDALAELIRTLDNNPSALINGKKK